MPKLRRHSPTSFYRDYSGEVLGWAISVAKDLAAIWIYVVIGIFCCIGLLVVDFAIHNVEVTKATVTLIKPQLLAQSAGPGSGLTVSLYRMFVLNR